LFLLALPKNPIKITLPNGSVKEGVSNQTSPFDVALGIAKSLAERVLVAKVRSDPFV
jgi:threonyl-tRNA synthetase